MSDQPENGPAGEAVSTGSAAIVEYLDGLGMEYELIEHEQTMSAAAEADATHRPANQVAKTLVLDDDGSYVVAVVPASERLDLHKLRELLGASGSLRLASEEEMAKDFPTVEVGALPPIGPMLPRAEVVDRRLLEETTILCAGGDHTHSLLVDPKEIVRVADAKVADVCAD